MCVLFRDKKYPVASYGVFLINFFLGSINLNGTRTHIAFAGATGGSQAEQLPGAVILHPVALYYSFPSNPRYEEAIARGTLGYSWQNDSLVHRLCFDQHLSQ